MYNIIKKRNGGMYLHANKASLLACCQKGSQGLKVLMVVTAATAATCAATTRAAHGGTPKQSFLGLDWPPSLGLLNNQNQLGDDNHFHSKTLLQMTPVRRW